MSLTRLLVLFGRTLAFLASFAMGSFIIVHALRSCAEDVRQALADTPVDPSEMVNYCDTDCAAIEAGELFMQRRHEAAIAECAGRGPDFALGCWYFMPDDDRPSH